MISLKIFIKGSYLDLSRKNLTLKELENKFKWNCEGLLKLNLLGNRLIEFPFRIFSAANLTELDISCCELQEIPKEFGEKLVQLRYFFCNQNQLKNLPDSLQNLNLLIILSIGYNFLKEIPSWLKKLTNLESLNVEHNRLETLPAHLKECTKLQELKANHNSIQVISKALVSLKRLELFNLESNMLPRSLVG